LSDEICQLQVEEVKNLKTAPSRIYNCLIGGQITAYARQVIYEHMLSLEKSLCTIYYVDCDCLIFTSKNIVGPPHPLPVSKATGHFKNEICGKIQNFFSFSIKNYSLSYKDSLTDTLQSITKIKGLFLKNELNEVNNDLFSTFFANIYNEQEKYLTQIRTQKNKRNIHKSLHCFKFPFMLTQKRLVKNNCGVYITEPYGFFHT
jgi:hypothetical protein